VSTFGTQRCPGRAAPSSWEHKCARFSPCSPHWRWPPASWCSGSRSPLPVMRRLRPRTTPLPVVCPDNGKLLACFAIRQADTVVPNLAANPLPNGYGPTDLRTAAL
jgi:hypothetical protein